MAVLNLRREKPHLPPSGRHAGAGVRGGGWHPSLLSWKAGKQILGQCRLTVLGQNWAAGSKLSSQALGGANTQTANTANTAITQTGLNHPGNIQGSSHMDLSPPVLPTFAPIMHFPVTDRLRKLGQEIEGPTVLHVDCCAQVVPKPSRQASAGHRLRLE